MIWILSIVGAFIGVLVGAFGKAHGLISGGVLGYLFALIMIDRARLLKIEKRLAKLDSAKHYAEEQPIALSTSVNDAELDKSDDNQQNNNVTDKESSSVITTDSKIDQAIDVKAQNSIDHMVMEHAVLTPVSAIENTRQQKVAKAQTPSTPKPRSPDIFEKMLGAVKRYFTEGNPIVRVGIVVLFFGVTFLVKYSIDNAIVPIEIRLAGVILGSVIMLVIGWRLRIKAAAYALIMQGGAVAIMFLAVFASFKLYHLISAGFAFPLLIAFSFLGMFLAVMQNSRALAVSAITGGFISPVLVSTGNGDHVALFSYYMILNIAIFSVSWFKSWRMLNVIGFLFTFIIGAVWGVTKYQAEHFASTEPFLISFFLIYVAISIIFAFKQKPELKGFVDATLVFGVPMVGFGLQAALVKHIEYGLAWSAFSLGLFYLLITKILWHNSNKNFRLLCEAMLALGVIFATLTIPFALDGRWTAASWAIEGAGLIWVGIRQQRSVVRYFGILVQFAGGVLFLIDYPYSSNAKPFINSEYLGVFIVSVAGLVSAYLYSHQKVLDRKNHIMDSVFLTWGLSWWYLGGISQLEKHLHTSYELSAQLLFVVVSAIIWLSVNLRFKWPLFRFFPWLLLVPLCFYTGIAIVENHIFANYGYIVFPLAIVTSYISFYCCDMRSIQLWGARILHGATYILLAVIIGAESYWQLYNASFSECWMLVVLATILVAQLQLVNKCECWPFKAHTLAYQKDASSVLIYALFLWSIIFNFFTFSDPAPLPYMPLINPVDIIQAIALFAIFAWYNRYGYHAYSFLHRDLVLKVMAGFCFVWANVILFKTLHVTHDVKYTVYALFRSDTVQTAIAIFWTLIGLALMVIASKKQLRQIWITGAVLTGIVVAKLFLLDLGARDTIERIVSFMIVGVLLLVVGYFAPVPPSRIKPSNENDNTEDHLKDAI